MNLVEHIEQKSFLGAEFATWLWFLGETHDGTLTIGKETFGRIEFLGDLVLTSDYGEAIASALKGENPSAAPEAGSALLAGKKVQRAKILVTRGETGYAFTLNARNFDIGGLRVEVPPSLSFEESLPLRLQAIDEFESFFSDLFSRFLDIRLDSDAWNRQIAKMRRWIDKKTSTEAAD